MSFRVENPAEAFAIIATLVRAADKIGSRQEKDYIFERAKSLDIFKDYDDQQFRELFTTVNQEVFISESTENLSVSDEEIMELCAEIKKVLTKDNIIEAYTMACELACSDRLLQVERNLLDRLQDNLDIDAGVASNILSKANKDD